MVRASARLRAAGVTPKRKIVVDKTPIDLSSDQEDSEDRMDDAVDSKRVETPKKGSNTGKDNKRKLDNKKTDKSKKTLKRENVLYTIVSHKLVASHTYKTFFDITQDLRDSPEPKKRDGGSEKDDSREESIENEDESDSANTRGVADTNEIEEDSTTESRADTVDSPPKKDAARGAKDKHKPLKATSSRSRNTPGEATEDTLYLMPKARRTQPLKILLHTKPHVVERIKTNLQERVLERFRRSCFGNYLDFEITNQSSQLLLHLIQRQCNPQHAAEINFLIGGRVLKFGLREFALITGLNCGPIPKVDRTQIKGGHHIKNTYFEGEKTVSRRYLNMAFNVNKNASDDDMLKVALLYFLESFLLPRKETVNVNMEHIEMVDDEDLFNSYPWGRCAFELLLDYMHKALVNKGATGITMGGFVFPLLAWAYEVIPTLSTPKNCFARKVSMGIPRIMNWAADTQPKWKDLDRKVFESPKLEISPLLATDDEMSMEFFKPFVDGEKHLRREFREQLAREHPVTNIADLTFNRGGTSMVDGKRINDTLELITNKLNLIEKNQEAMNKRLDELVGSVNLMIDYLKNRQVTDL